MHYTKHKKQIKRILEIASRLLQMQSISLPSEAARFGVSKRTIRRDLEKIGQTLPLKRTPEGWRVDLAAKTSQPLDHALLQAFAESARIRAACLDRHTNDKKTVELAIRYHRLPKELGEILLEAIRTDRLCRFDYRDKDGKPTHRTAAPVKLLSFLGVWYLVAYDTDKREPRTFRLDRIKNLTPLETSRNLTSEMLLRLEEIRDPWSNPTAAPQPIRLYADAYAAGYLNDTPLHPSQCLEEAHTDGGAIYLYRITHPMELMPKIKSWIPHLKILEPESWIEELEKELKNYIGDK